MNKLNNLLKPALMLALSLLLCASVNASASAKTSASAPAPAPKPPQKIERQVRIITLVSPSLRLKNRWMPSIKERGLAKDYTAQDILEMIADLKPTCLERFITGSPDPKGLVPVRKGCPPMTVLEFLNAAILAGGENCEIVPKLNLRWLGGTGEYFWKAAQELYDLPLVRPIRNINLDVWDYYCSEVAKTPAQRSAMFKRLRAIGYKKIGVNMTGTKTNDPQIDYADFNMDKTTWQVKADTAKKIKSYPNIKNLYLYIDYPGTMDAFMKNSPDKQADIYCKNIFPKQKELGITFVYAIIQDKWVAMDSVTSKDGPYKGKTMYDITKALLNKAGE